MSAQGHLARLRVVIHGAVQGVGFRPFVYRLATELKLTGWVLNSAQGVFIEVEGTQEQLEEFLQRLERDKPPRAFIQSLESAWLDPLGYPAFEIRHSDESGEKTAFILPDIATCPDCLKEIFDPNDRRYLRGRLSARRSVDPTGELVRLKDIPAGSQVFIDAHIFII